MPRNVQVRNVPERVHRELKARAAADGSSLSGYLLKELERIAERPPVAEVLRRARDRHGGASTREIVRATREARERP